MGFHSLVNIALRSVPYYLQNVSTRLLFFSRYISLHTSSTLFAAPFPRILSKYGPCPPGRPPSYFSYFHPALSRSSLDFRTSFITTTRRVALATSKAVNSIFLKHLEVHYSVHIYYCMHYH